MKIRILLSEEARGSSVVDSFSTDDIDADFQTGGVLVIRDKETRQTIKAYSPSGWLNFEIK